MWGEVSLCDTPPTLILHVNLIEHFITAQVLQLQLVTGNV
jgi:hypothetical protein